MTAARRLALALDLDGVVIESVEGKADAFVATFAARWPTRAQEVRDYNRLHFGIPRTRKMRHLLSRLAPGEPHDELLEHLLADYAHRLTDALPHFPLVAGVRALLEARRYDVFICSAAPMGEILAILEHHGLRQTVCGIFDGTTPKREALRRIVAITKSSIVFVGDAAADQQAAADAGFPFILRLSGPDAEQLTASTRIADFRDFDRTVASVLR